MKISLVSSSNGFYDFDVTDAGSIHRVTVDENIRRGDRFNIYHGESSKSGGVWQGEIGIGGYLVGDLERSIRQSDVFIEESASNGAQCHDQNGR